MRIYDIVKKRNAIAAPADDDTRPVYDIEHETSRYTLLYDEEIILKDVPEDVINSFKEMEEYEGIALPADDEKIFMYETQAEDGTRITWYTADSWEE
jgi:hypothetical protein